jgi:5-methylcytosine-specific restriction endonuclease McrA
MSDLKRLAVKYCRDKAKSKYIKETKCYICGSTEDLEFHHFFSLTCLLEAWLKRNKLTMNTADEAMLYREQFIAEHEKEIYEDTVTLCKKHHELLHKVYTIKPALSTAEKQKRWVERQREKLWAGSKTL